MQLSGDVSQSDALEAAAKACEREADEWLRLQHDVRAAACRECAVLIRGLRQPPAPPLVQGEPHGRHRAFAGRARD